MSQNSVSISLLRRAGPSAGGLHSLPTRQRIRQNSPPQATAPALPAAPQQSAQAAAPRSSAPAQQQRVQQLIQQVEKAYSAGKADYRKGKLLEAKAEFDRAVDLMLTSGIDIKSDPQLQDEFDRIVDQVNALEMEALKQGNGFAPKVEPSPADVASDVTFAVDPEHRGQGQDRTGHHQVRPAAGGQRLCGRFINFFANTQRGHNTLLHSFERSGRYRAMIQRVMAEEGVPQDLIYLAVAESGFQPRALNPPFPRRRHVAVHAPWRTTASPATATSTSASIPKNPRAPTPAT